MSQIKEAQVKTVGIPGYHYRPPVNPGGSIRDPRRTGVTPAPAGRSAYKMPKATGRGSIYIKAPGKTIKRGVRPTGKGLREKQLLKQIREMKTGRGTLEEREMKKPLVDYLNKYAQHLDNVEGRQFDDREVLRAVRDATMAEHDAVKQYETVSDAAEDPEVKELLQDIADEEKVHIGELQALLKKKDPAEEKSLEEGETEVNHMNKEARMNELYIDRQVRIQANIIGMMRDYLEKEAAGGSFYREAPEAGTEGSFYREAPEVEPKVKPATPSDVVSEIATKGAPLSLKGPLGLALVGLTIGSMVGAARKKQPGESKLEAIVGSGAKGAAMGGGFGIGSVLGLPIGALGGAGLGYLAHRIGGVEGLTEEEKRQRLLKYLGIGGAGGALAGALGGAGLGAYGGHRLATKLIGR